MIVVVPETADCIINHQIIFHGKETGSYFQANPWMDERLVLFLGRRTMEIFEDEGIARQALDEQHEPHHPVMEVTLDRKNRIIVSPS
jgi:hypothetical protein